MSAYIKAGVIGHPINHSKSPLIHSYWIETYGPNGSYDAIDIEPEKLKDGVQKLIDTGYAGFNVTVPHKQEIFKLCESVEETARAIGAVNTVVIKEGRLFGSNTDAFGFIENIRRSIAGIDFGSRPCVVLGAGGAARAVVYGLIGAGAKSIIIANRSRDKADDIVRMNTEIVRAVDWDARNAALDGAGFLVNTTSLGMTGKPELSMDLSNLPVDAVVSDIVYAPLKTSLLVQAESRGNHIVTGIGMLLHQARPAFEKWFGVLPDVTEELQKKVLE